jgi:hypothetical protein
MLNDKSHDQTPFAAHVGEIGSTQKFSVPCLFGVLHGFGEPALACFNR